jgi:hypothetical protein
LVRCKATLPYQSMRRTAVKRQCHDRWPIAKSHDIATRPFARICQSRHSSF